MGCVKQNTKGRCSLGPGRDMAVRGKGHLLDIPAPILLPRSPNFRQPLDICQHTLHGPHLTRLLSVSVYPGL